MSITTPDQNSTRRSLNCFVIMPFGSNSEYKDGPEESEFVYNSIILRAIEKARQALGCDIEVTREIDRGESGSITASIVRSLAKADIVIADLTGQNPNVFLELGMRYTMRPRITILMTQTRSAIPFDVHAYRTVVYKIVRAERAVDDVLSAIEAGVNKGASDSLVYDALADMTIKIPPYFEHFGKMNAETEGSTQQWPEYWSRISALQQLLKGPVTEGHFTPDAVLGISNGGLIVADLLGRLVFQGSTPILSLYAERTKNSAKKNPAFWFFDNPYNDAIMAAVKQEKSGASACLLLVDDHLGTGTTLQQAVSYINDRLGDGEAEILFLPLFSNRIEYLKNVEAYLPYRFREGSVFRGITEDGFRNSLRTSSYRYPYEKEIGRSV